MHPRPRQCHRPPPRGKKSRDGAVPPPPHPPPTCCRLPLHVAVRGMAPVAAAGGRPGPKEEASRTTTVAIAASPYHRCRCFRRRRRRRCHRHHALTLASTITITAASADVTASPMLLSMVGCCVVCHPSPTASSAVRIYQPPPSCDRRRFRRRAAVPFYCRSFTEHQMPLPLPLMVGCCILRPPSSIPTTSLS
jgi:hypothetical protein